VKANIKTLIVSVFNVFLKGIFQEIFIGVVGSQGGILCSVNEVVLLDKTLKDV